MIEASELVMQFGSRQAVAGISFSVEPGTVVGFLGPNGAGKTTTMRMLTGYLAPSRGHARICGFDLQHQRSEAQRCFGYLPEAAGGFADLTVREFLTLCAETRGLRGKACAGAIDKTCDDIQLADALDTRMRTLSKGWRQRAWLAQSLLHDPQVLIMDEPTDGLDPNQKRQVRELIRTISPHKAILLSTHILEEVEEICQRAIIIDQGTVVADDTPANLADENGRLASAFHSLTQRNP